MIESMSAEDALYKKIGPTLHATLEAARLEGVPLNRDAIVVYIYIRPVVKLHKCVEEIEKFGEVLGYDSKDRIIKVGITLEDILKIARNNWVDKIDAEPTLQKCGYS